MSASHRIATGSVTAFERVASPRPAPREVQRAGRPRAPVPSLVVKHVLDRVVAALLGVVLLPLLVLVALAVKLSSPGPVLYRQRRIGRQGHTFEILKFRSMVAAVDGVRHPPAPGAAPGGVEGVDRRTRVGRLLRRTSLDELPQLLNVLRGEMSLVGPRPERPEFVQLFADEVLGYADRLRIPVGITGLAQVRGLRGQTSIVLRAAADNEYIERWSLLLDLQVILLTARAVLQPPE